jgi:hypothetical protein
MNIRPEHHEIEREWESKGLTYFQLRYDPTLFQDASCKGMDTELFYPDKRMLPQDEARFFNMLCHTCPVREACMEWGLAHEKYGIWGGLTQDQRHLYRKAMKWGVNDLTAGEFLPL